MFLTWFKLTNILTDKLSPSSIGTALPYTLLTMSFANDDLRYHIALSLIIYCMSIIKIALLIDILVVEKRKRVVYIEDSIALAHPDRKKYVARHPPFLPRKNKLLFAQLDSYRPTRAAQTARAPLAQQLLRSCCSCTRRRPRLC